MSDLPEGGESRTVSSFTTAGAEYASTVAWSSFSHFSSSPYDAFLNSNDQRWSSSGTNTVGSAAVTGRSGGLSGISASL